MSQDRGRLIRDTLGLVLYLCGGWRSYQEIGKEFDWRGSKTPARNVRALEATGLPIEWVHPPDEKAGLQRMRLPQDWVAHTPWLRQYIIRKQPVQARKEFYK